MICNTSGFDSSLIEWTSAPLEDVLTGSALRIQRAIMWTGIAVAVITAVYAFFAIRQWQALRDANVTAKKALDLSERVWRDSRRAFLEFVKPDFDGEVVSHINGPYKEPKNWYLFLVNGGVITSPEYVVEQTCVGAFAKEPAVMPCKHEPSEFRPLAPHADLDDGRIDPRWIREPTALTFDEVALGEKHIFVFVLMSYDDGLGRKWERPGCWIYTKKTASGALMPADEHIIKRCRLHNTPERLASD